MNYITTLVRDNEQSKLNYRRTAFIGLGFLIITATWSLYNAFVPIFLNRFIERESVIGFIMTFDNIAAISLQPVFGALSDNTNTRYGHRLPFMMVGAPLAAFFFALIPFAPSFWVLLTFLVIMNLAMSIFRAPAVALMPDLTPSPLRSKANGVINFMGGLGAVLTFAIGSMLYDLDKALPFVLFAFLLLLITVLFIWKLREPPIPGQNERASIFKAIKAVFRGGNRRVLYILMAIFFWFLGYSGIEAFFTLYGKNYLGIKESAAAFSLMFFSLTFVLFAIPSGILAEKIGRKRTIISGIIGLIVVFAGLAVIRDLLFIRVLLFIGGVFWALINISSYPMIVDQAGGKVGTFTGVYYFFSTIPAILAPIFVGRLIEWFGYPALFINSVVGFLLALIFMLKVKEKAEPTGS